MWSSLWLRLCCVYICARKGGGLCVEAFWLLGWLLGPGTCGSFPLDLLDFLVRTSMI